MKLFELFTSKYKTLENYYTSRGEGREIQIGDNKYKIEFSYDSEYIKDENGKTDVVQAWMVDFFVSGGFGQKKFTSTGDADDNYALITAVKDFTEEQINSKNPEYFKFVATSDNRMTLYKKMVSKFLLNKYDIIKETNSSMLLKRKS